MGCVSMSSPHANESKQETKRPDNARNRQRLTITAWDDKTVSSPFVLVPVPVPVLEET